MKDKVIFDLDGTLLNTLDDLADAVNFALEKQDFPLRTLSEIRSFVGNGIRKLVERAVPSDCDSESLEKCYDDFCEYYKAHMEDKTAPYDGIIELLQSLKNAGIKTAIVTNKADFAAQELCGKLFGDLITITIGANDTIRHKPYPDGTLKALEFLGATPEEAYFVGDSDVDAKTAENAGVEFVGVLWGFRDKSVLESLGVMRFAENTGELESILLGK